MKIIIAIILSVVVNTNLNAQNTKEEFEVIKNEIIMDFSNIKPNELTDLVPFNIKRNWGYIDRKTKKIVIPAKYSKLEFFNPTMRGYYKRESFEVNTNGDIHFDSDEPQKETILTEFNSSIDSDSSVRIVSSSDGYKGFKVNEKGDLLEYSDIYKNRDVHGWNVRPFKKKDTYYAIALNKTQKYGIIDASGNTIEGFDFNYKNILLNKYSKDEDNLWFFVQNDNNLWSLKSYTNKTKFKDKILSYPLTSSTVFGLTRMEKDGIFAIFDCNKMKWMIKPQKEKVGWLYYSSKTKLDTEISSQIKNATIYLSVQENEQKHFIDLKGNEFKPTE